jgi:hypothetical protein
MALLIEYLLALIASYQLGGWWAVILCFCIIEIVGQIVKYGGRISE